jgi:DNA-directed RNA polymerase specialized sigma subunit
MSRQAAYYFLPLLYTISRQKYHALLGQGVKGIDLEEMIDVGYLALVEALAKYEKAAALTMWIDLVEVEIEKNRLRLNDYITDQDAADVIRIRRKEMQLQAQGNDATWRELAAALSFDPEKLRRLSIKGEMIDALQDFPEYARLKHKIVLTIFSRFKDWSRKRDFIPQADRTQIKKINEKRNELQQKLGQQPSDEKLADLMDVKVETIRLLLQKEKFMQSLDALWEEGGDNLLWQDRSHGDQGMPSENIPDWLHDFDDCLERLSDPDRRLMILLKDSKGYDTEMIFDHFAQKKPKSTISTYLRLDRKRVGRCMEEKGYQVDWRYKQVATISK